MWCYFQMGREPVSEEDADRHLRRIISLPRRSETTKVSKLFIYQCTTNRPSTGSRPKGYDAGLLEPHGGRARMGFYSFKRATNPAGAGPLE